MKKGKIKKPTLVEEPTKEPKAKKSKNKRPTNADGLTYSARIAGLVAEGRLENEEIKKIVLSEFPDRDHKWTGQLISHHRWLSRSKKKAA